MSSSSSSGPGNARVVLHCQNLTAEFLATQKKLQDSWSAQHVARSLSKTLLEDLCTNFDMLERKAKMRVLVSSLALDSKKKVDLRHPLLRLLKAAVETSNANTSDVWVSITAGIVYERLFGSEREEDGEGICNTSRTSLQGTMGSTVDQVMKMIQTDIKGVNEENAKPFSFAPYVLPLRHNFLPAPDKVIFKSGSHFEYLGKDFDIMKRERKRQKMDDDLNENRSSLMNVGSAPDVEAKRRKVMERQDAQRSSTAHLTSSSNKERPSLVASVASQGQKLRKASAQSMSMEAVKASRLNPENLTVAEKRELAKKTKLVNQRKTADTKKKEKEEKSAKKAGEVEIKQRLSQEKTNESKDQVSLQSAPVPTVETHTSSTNSEQMRQPQQQVGESNSQVLKEVESSNLLNPVDKALIVAFFGGSDSTDTQTVPLEGIGRFLIKESPILDENTGQKIGKEMTYLDLDYIAKTFKFITKKAFRKNK